MALMKSAHGGYKPDRPVMVAMHLLRNRVQALAAIDDLHILWGTLGPLDPGGRIVRRDDIGEISRRVRRQAV